GAERLPGISLPRHEALRRDGRSSGTVGPSRGQAAAPFLELRRVEPYQERLRIGIPPGNARGEPGRQLGGKATAQRAVQSLQALEILVQQAELLVAELGRSGLERLGPRLPLGGPASTPGAIGPAARDPCYR